MRLGPLEIGIIIVVMIFAAVIMRTVRVARLAAEKDKKSSVKIPERQTEQNKRKRRFKLGGIIFILTGVLLLLSGVSMFKWVLWSYLWSFIIAAIGLVMLFMSRKR
tara:strand:+ start:6857 stop:7174 length:318 start_codon:yes stop_codon:yes gene_type:complete